MNTKLDLSVIGDETLDIKKEHKAKLDKKVWNSLFELINVKINETFLDSFNEEVNMT